MPYDVFRTVECILYLCIFVYIYPSKFPHIDSAFMWCVWWFFMSLVMETLANFKMRFVLNQIQLETCFTLYNVVIIGNYQNPRTPTMSCIHIVVFLLVSWSHKMVCQKWQKKTVKSITVIIWENIVPIELVIIGFYNMFCNTLFLQRAFYTVHCVNITHSTKPSFVITHAAFSQHCKSLCF